MGNFGNCHTCGYEAKSVEEVQKWIKWGCARALEKNVQNSGMNVELCSQNNGLYYAPGTNPNALPEEDPNALKEGYIKMLEQNKKKPKDGKEPKPNSKS